MDANSTLPTIESFLEAGLHKIGCITDANHRILSKIGWSRSSRTDKGVHSARMVVSAKLEIDELSWLVGRDTKAPTIARLLNSQLPSDIRVFAAAKMNQGFRARESCHFREYEYLLPLRMLTSAGVGSAKEEVTSWKNPPLSAEEAIKDLNEALKKMIGTKSFHNFHKLSPKNLRSKGSKPYGQDQDEVEEEEVEDEDPVVDESTDKMTDATLPSSNFVYCHYDPWVKRARDLAPKTRCTIYSFRAEEVRIVNGIEMVCIRVRGQAFLLHQIRLMISAAVLAARGVIPYLAIDLAFLVPYHVNFPLAPAEGLILVDAGFSRNANGKTVSINGVAGRDADYVIMENDEFENSEQFKTDKIYSQICSDFTDTDKRLQDTFLEFMERFRVPEYVGKEWQELVAHYGRIDDDENRLRDQRESCRIQREVGFFRNELLEKDESYSDYFHLVQRLPDKESAKKRRYAVIPHKKLLPNGLATDIVIRFGTLPSSVVVSDALRALASRMVIADEGDISPLMNGAEIISFMEEKGSLDWWAAQKKHCMID